MSTDQKSFAAGKVTVDPVSHQPCVTDSAYGINGLREERPAYTLVTSNMAPFTFIQLLTSITDLTTDV